MSKPICEVTVTASDGKKKRVPALVDSGSFFTIIRTDCLPSAKAVLPLKRSYRLGTAARKGSVKITARTVFVVEIAGKRIQTSALVSPNLKREMIIGAETMQGWDISVRNRNGSTRVVVGRDMRDPDVVEVA